MWFGSGYFSFNIGLNGGCNKKRFVGGNFFLLFISF